MKLHNDQLRRALQAAAMVAVLFGIYRMISGAPAPLSAYLSFAAMVAVQAMFLLVLSRAVSLQQRWSRIFGLLNAIALVLQPSWLALAGLLFTVAFLVCWKYKNDEVAAAAQRAAWPPVPFMARYGVAASMLGVSLVLGAKVAPTMLHVYGPQAAGAQATAWVARATDPIAIALLLVLLLWWFLPPITERGRLLGKLSVFASALVCVACLVALYLPIFLVGKA